MLQRIQSVYLLACVLTYLIVFICLINDYFPFNIWMAIFSIIISVLSCYTIFNFKNRKRQLLMCNILVVLAVIFTLLFAYFLKTENIYIADNFSMMQIIKLLPIFSIIFINLAKKGIKKDEEMVKSAERLR